MNLEIMYITATAIALIMFGILAISHFHHEFPVPEGYVALLYHEGKFVAILPAGRHIRWGRHYTVVAQDLRRTTLSVASQEVMTSDNVALKLSLVVAYQVADPVKAAHETQNWQGDLYNFAQLALRTIIGRVAAEELLGQRGQISAQLLEQVQPEAAKIGLTIHSVEVKDVMFPSDLKRAFTEALKSKHESIAALERARGESAALRNLANAARLLEGNPGLMNLRLMQSLTSAQAAGQTLMFGMPGGFVPLKSGKTLPATENPAES